MTASVDGFRQFSAHEVTTFSDGRTVPTSVVEQALDATVGSAPAQVAMVYHRPMGFDVARMAEVAAQNEKPAQRRGSMVVDAVVNSDQNRMYWQ